MTRVLVTGGAGFIGSALVRHLVLDKGYEVLNVDKLTYAGSMGSLDAVRNNALHHFLKADICDAAAMAEAFASFRPDRVMHLAAESHVDRSIAGADDFMRTNIMGTYTLLTATRAYLSGLPEQARKAFRFLHVSTDEVYGSLGDVGHFHETTPYDPSSPYSASKAASDHLVKAWGRTFGVPVLVSNCSNNYGPFQFPEKLIPLTTLNAIEGLTLPVYGTGANVRDWLHVEDHVLALDLIAERGRPGETYNVGGGNEWRNIDVVRSICRHLDNIMPAGAPRETLIRFVTDRRGHDRRYAISSAKLRDELGWTAAHDFASGIQSTIEWYLDNAWWWKPIAARGAVLSPGPQLRVVK